MKIIIIILLASFLCISKVKASYNLAKCIQELEGLIQLVRQDEPRLNLREFWEYVDLILIRQKTCHTKSIVEQDIQFLKPIIEKELAFLNQQPADYQGIMNTLDRKLYLETLNIILRKAHTQHNIDLEIQKRQFGQYPKKDKMIED